MLSSTPQALYQKHQPGTAAAVAPAAAAKLPSTALLVLRQRRRLLAGICSCSTNPYSLLRKFAESRTAQQRTYSSLQDAAMAAATQISANKCFGGYNRRYKHASSSLGCDMTFTVYFPPAADETAASPSKVPVLYYLSGLTCTDENASQKSGVQRACAQHGIAFIAPDTSPRGLNVEGEAEAWDFGVGAGFYINATVDKWKNWRMYDYITKELPALLAASFPTLDTTTASIMGHSMGGHGAMTIALKNPGAYKSLSAFAPICNPCNVPWGVKAFTGYFGEDNKELWKAHDATELVKAYSGPALPTLVDTGSGDGFLEVQLKPEAFQAAADAAGFPVTMRMQEGYDHSYFFMASFIDEHVAFHAKHLKA